MKNYVGERLVFRSKWDGSFMSTFTTTTANSKKPRDDKFSVGWMIEPNGDGTYAIKTPLGLYLNLQSGTKLPSIITDKKSGRFIFEKSTNQGAYCIYNVDLNNFISFVTESEVRGWPQCKYDDDDWYVI